MTNTISFTLSAAAACVFQLDEPTMYPGEWSCVPKGKRSVLVTMEERGARLLLDDARSRSHSGGGWDQPLAWYATARATARIVAAALAAR